MQQIKLFLTDCDGVLTDGGMYYFKSGDEAKKFNTRDGMAFKFLKEQNIKIGIISGEDTNIVYNRAKKIKIDYIFLGVQDKVKVISSLINELKIEYKNVLYVGDDINDLELLQKAGFSACPKNAEKMIINNVNYVSTKNGREGVIRDIVNNFFIGDYNGKRYF